MIPFKRGLLDKFQYCDSNIELFSIAPHLVIALQTLRQQKLSLLIPLLQFLYKFCRLVHGFFSVLLPIQLSLFQLLRQQQLSLFYALKAIAKSKSTHIAIAFKSDSFTGSNREKFNKAIAILEKIHNLKIKNNEIKIIV